MKRLITFRKLKWLCAFQTATCGCGYINNKSSKCCAKDCPIWQRLKEPKREVARLKHKRRQSACRLCGCVAPPGREICDRCAVDVMR